MADVLHLFSIEPNFRSAAVIIGNTDPFNACACEGKRSIVFNMGLIAAIVIAACRTGLRRPCLLAIFD